MPTNGNPAAAIALIASGEQPPPEEARGPTDWYCQECGMMYEELFGDPESGVEPLTPFAEIAGDWDCPVCGEPKATFIPVET